ncbi:MAG: GNAT family N-acetyltransferase [Candidatus Bathyarchaeota archaeon]|nr:GNAT family N-acetyltransferase [Candidatus Bathyarchaeota archaeon]MDH5786910.1 GNAT family N-acetyltransferase [Candidatus Bathyarchaeota archaeon]
MSPEDFKFAVRLTDTKGWKFIEEDFQFMKELEPEGCFVLFEDSERIGIVTSINFGEIGWLGNLIVKEKYRRRGAGAMLARQVIAYLTSKNVETVGLYAYMDIIPFYEKIGFKYDSDFTVLEGKAFASQVGTNLIEARREDYQKIVEFDSYYFGASRKKLLEAILRNASNLCYLAVEDGRILGYVMTKVYEGIAEIGPLVCQSGRSDIAIDLIRSIFNRLESFEVSFCILRKEEAILNFLKKSGIDERFHVARMFFRPTSLKECTYIAESLERG